MTVLERVVSEDVELRRYEAPYEQTNGRERHLWLYEGIPCFSAVVSQFWSLYCKPFSDVDHVYLDFPYELDERRRFIKQPITVALQDGFVVGGAWMDEVAKTNGKHGGLMHIKVDREHRKVAHPLLEFFLDWAKQRYDFVNVAWGPREPEDNPTNFFKRNGFAVSCCGSRGYAHKALR